MSEYAGSDKRLKELFENRGGGGGAAYTAGVGINISDENVISVTDDILNAPKLCLDDGYIALDYGNLEVI